MSANGLRPRFDGLACVLVFFIALSFTSNAIASGPGNPKPDINIVGPTKDPDDIRDEGLKQQNEPACTMRPGDGDCIICFFNDYRTVDIFEHQDAWIGMAESCDAGETWFSRVTPGHPTHPAPIGTKFAADPRAIGVPGMTIHGFIGGFRDQDSGVVAVQHWLENNQEDGDYNEPALDTIIVEQGTEGRFTDKPEIYFKMNEGDPQETITLSFDMENPDLGTIERTFPAGTLFAAYAVFTGSQSVKILVKRSDDLGKTWRNQTKKLTESQNLVSGITMTSLGDTVMAMWRQVQDVNDMDAIYYATSNNDGNSWSKPKLLTEICRFDQPSATQTSPVALATFRTNDFPWLANDGKNIYAFYTERVGGCDTGTPKVFMRSTSNGNSWKQPRQIDDSAEAAPGAQFMPAASAARGKVQVAWYDTRREDFPFDPSVPFVADYIPMTGLLINRKVDVYTARITSGANGNPVNISESVRVSQPRTIRDASDPNGPPYEIEASFANAKMYASGFLAFLGDYLAVAAQLFREDGNGGWEENQSPLPDSLNLTNFFIAYADNRDVRGNVLFDGTGGQNSYTPPDNEAPGSTYVNPEDADKKAMLANNAAESESSINGRQSAEGIEDGFTDPSTACVPAQDRTRDANIYGSLIRDELRLSTPVPSRPLSGIMRAIPFIARDVSTDVPPPPPAIPPAKPYRLYISNQPGAVFAVNRASFRQQPSVGPFPSAPPLVDLIEDVEIQRNSALARTVFLVSPDIGATVEVEIYDGACAAATNNAAGLPTIAFTTACDVLGSITLGGSSTAGELQQPDYLSSVCKDEDGNPVAPEDCDISVTELHNPLLENPLLENPVVANPLLENPLLENMEVANPLLENPLLENLGYANPLLENPLLENPLLENSGYANPLLENPLLENPLLENSAFASGELTFVDETAVVRNDGNVTTAYNFDATVANFVSTNGGDPISQIILWKQYVTGTSRDCDYRPEVRNVIVATINQPDNILQTASIEEPFAGEASMILAPGEQGFVTHRAFGLESEVEFVRVNAFTASSQAANCDEFDDNVGPGPGEDPIQFYECEEQIVDERELILIEVDVTPPSFDGINDGDTVPLPPDFIPGNTEGGACLDPVLSGLVSASDDSGGPVSIVCTNNEGTQICDIAELDGFLVTDGSLSIPISNIAGQPLSPSPTSCTATDENGNSLTVNFFINVQDDVPPDLAGTPANTNAVADGSGTASVDLTAGLIADDVVDPSPTISCSADTTSSPGDPLPIGTSQITCIATDQSGLESAPFVYSIVVTDNDAPVFTSVPAAITADATSSAGAVVTFSATASDNDPLGATVSCDPPSGSTFPLGQTTVTCTAEDPSGNQAQAQFTVTVEDNDPPTVMVPTDPVFESIQGPAGAVVDYSALVSVSDTIDPNPTLDCQPPSGSTFAIGDTSVTCIGTDSSGNSSTEIFTVSVGYGGGIGIFANKYNVKAGSTNQLSWAWQDGSNNNVDSSGDMQLIRVVDCDDPSMIVLDVAGDPGSSGFKYRTDDSWEYNWQTDYPDGSPLDRGDYCPSVESSLTGETLIIVPRPVFVR